MKLGTQTTPDFSAYRPEHKDAYTIEDLFTQSDKANVLFVSTARAENTLQEVQPSDRYYTPKKELSDHIKQHSIYGDDLNEISFEIVTRKDGNVLFMKYRNIIGGNAVCYIRKKGIK